MKLKFAYPTYNKIKYSQGESKYYSKLEDFETVELSLENGQNYFYKKDIVEKLVTKYEYYNSVYGLQYDNIEHVVSEIQTTLSIESYYSTKKIIEEILNSKNNTKTDIEKLIKNTYNALEYVKKINYVDENTILKIYKFLSQDMEIENNEDIYRENDVYITDGIRQIDRGVNSEKIKELMDQLIIFINNKNNIIDNAFISYQFLYIHPYYDFNGRTSRIIDKINNENNIGLSSIIAFNKSAYYNAIRESRNSYQERDITTYIEFYIKSSINHIFYQLLEIEIKAVQEIEFTQTELVNIKIIYNQLNTLDEKFNAKKYEEMFKKITEKKSRQSYDKDLKVLVQKEILVIEKYKNLSLYKLSNRFIKIYNSLIEGLES